MSATSAQVEIEGDVCHLAGVVDFHTAPKLFDQVNGRILPNGKVLVDFSRVTHANSVALALLLSWQERASEQQCTLSHQNLPESIQKLSHICQVNEFI